MLIPILVADVIERNEKPLFNELYDLYSVQIKRFIYTVTRKSITDTEDVFQETWLNVYRYLSSLKDVTKAKSWIYAVAKNEAKRYYSKHYESHERLDELSEINTEEISDDFSEQFADVDLVANLVNKLSEKEQRYILLRYMYELKYVEISSLYGDNESSVKTTVRRAIAKMKKEMMS